MSFDGTVVTEDAVVSPLTGLRAAAVRVTLLAKRQPGKHPATGDPLGFGGGGGPDTFTRIGDVWFGSELVLADADAQEVVVATTGLGVRAANIDRGATPLGPVRPPELAQLLASAPEGLVFYRELRVHHGERMRLKATVFPVGPRRWETRPDVGPVVLQELGPGSAAKARTN